MDIIVTTRRESGIPDEDILDLINRSYAVWKENGLDGPFMHYTLEEFRRETAHAISSSQSTISTSGGKQVNDNLRFPQNYLEI